MKSGKIIGYSWVLPPISYPTSCFSLDSNVSGPELIPGPVLVSVLVISGPNVWYRPRSSFFFSPGTGPGLHFFSSPGTGWSLGLVMRILRSKVHRKTSSMVKIKPHVEYFLPPYCNLKLVLLYFWSRHWSRSRYW